MKKAKPSFSLLSVFLTFTLITSCTFIQTKVEPLNKNEIQESERYIIKSSAKVHLYDGSVVVFEKGFTVTGDTINGNGWRYNLTRRNSTSVKSVPIDSVACIEYYKKEWQADAFLASIPPIAVASFVGGMILWVSIFGSCPTIYSFDGEDYTLEAEEFSYSIAKRFEGNDFDRLDSGKILNGEYTIKVANEALETHYINNLSLLTVDHPSGYEVFPTKKRGIILFGKEAQILEAVSKSGSNVTELISDRDNYWYQSDSLAVQELTHTITRDWIDVKVRVPQDAKKMYIAFRLRNTLLNTVLLYDVMLSSQSFEAVDWLGSKTSNIFYALKLDKWYQKHFGLHIQMFDGEKYKEVIRISDTGPIAWHQEAVELPVPDRNIAQLRFSFLPDNWFIDWIGVSFDRNENYSINTIACSELTDYKGNRRDSLIALFKKKDKDYFVTYPGESYLLKFKAGDVPEGMRRSYFVKSRGFYIEWLRKEWLTKTKLERKELKLEFNDETIIKTAQLWIEKKPQYDKKFYESKLPSRGGNN